MLLHSLFFSSQRPHSFFYSPHPHLFFSIQRSIRVVASFVSLLHDTVLHSSPPRYRSLSFPPPPSLRVVSLRSRRQTLQPSRRISHPHEQTTPSLRYQPFTLAAPPHTARTSTRLQHLSDLLFTSPPCRTSRYPRGLCCTHNSTV